MSKSILQRVQRLSDSNPGPALAVAATVIRKAATTKDRDALDVFTTIAKNLRLLTEAQQNIVVSAIEQLSAPPSIAPMLREPQEAADQD